MTSIAYGVVRRDLLVALRSRSEVLTTMIFFVIVASLFPLGIGPEAKILRVLGRVCCGWRHCSRPCSD